MILAKREGVARNGRLRIGRPVKNSMTDHRRGCCEEADPNQVGGALPWWRLLVTQREVSALGVGRGRVDCRVLLSGRGVTAQTPSGMRGTGLKPYTIDFP